MLPLGLRVLLGEAENPPVSMMSQPNCRATISDWLDFNGLTREAVLRQLALIEPQDGAAFDRSEAQTQLGLTADEAWALCAASMRKTFPVMKQEIDHVETNVLKCLQPKSVKHPKPFTYDLGFQKLPFVSLHYQDRPADLLKMAHEFGHAMQIVASWQSGEKQMPPVARECCAFNAELALLNAQNEKVKALLACHQADSAVYFGEDKAALESALLVDRSPYRYCWNYPLARQFTARLINSRKTDHAVAIFRAGQGGGQLLAQLIANVGAKGIAA